MGTMRAVDDGSRATLELGAVEGRSSGTDECNVAIGRADEVFVAKSLVVDGGQRFEIARTLAQLSWAGHGRQVVGCRP